MDQKNVIIDVFEQAWANQNYQNIKEVIADDMILHIRGITIEVSGTGLINIIDRWKDTFPDLHFEILHIVEEDNLVTVNSILHGTMVKSWKSYEPTGQKISIPHAFFFKFKHKKISEVWEINDFTVLEEQLTQTN